MLPCLAMERFGLVWSNTRWASALLSGGCRMSESKNYIILHDFMMGGGLNLKNLNLMVYAHIYSFWDNGREMYQSCSTIAKLTGYTREAVNRSLKELEEDKYIVRLPLHGRFGNHYYTIDEKTLSEKLAARCDKTSQVEERCDSPKDVRCDENAQVKEGCDESSQGGVIKNHGQVCKKRTGRCAETAHDNKRVQEETTMKGDSDTEAPPFLQIVVMIRSVDGCGRSSCNHPSGPNVPRPLWLWLRKFSPTSPSKSAVRCWPIRLKGTTPGSTNRTKR